ncbi:cobalamin biosynthesis protein CbiX [Hydrococcus rivularis NIES-593]|uniref:Cobalamin biosynthesis protein CbiX n=1 Tax=Hydrococcus rivularis NIES-593 TaxID=1921803 RepID=A0A1U7HAH4_9CYAN|nr:sirohydrochlorin chelatase [Hydrococcus rivularis]OKH20597.1 cobalamin biosynthesis protein CbiX [Hydrococcus rivularis NIES-593]
MQVASAHLLVSHGSRDPRSQIALRQLASRLRQRKPAIAQSRDLKLEIEGSAAVSNQPALSLIDTACLEAAPAPLHATIERVAQKAREAGLNRLEILPLFLLAGVHVKEDIPREVAIAQRALGESVRVELRPYLGSYPRLANLLTQQLERLPAQARILLSHGSRRPGGNQPCQEIASRLGAIPAYWSVSPTLAERIETLARSGEQSIAILPYFLFSGGITDAIAQQIQQLKQAFPKLKLLLGEPLGATAELADLIIEEIDEWRE